MQHNSEIKIYAIVNLIGQCNSISTVQWTELQALIFIFLLNLEIFSNFGLNLTNIIC